MAKIDPTKDYSLPFAPNDMQEETVDAARQKYFPSFTIRGDIVYKLHRYGYTNEHVLTSIANCIPNHCLATYFLLEQNHEFIA
jgi:hypothetical protein